MPDRPYVVLSCAMSIDGYIDDATDQRLLLSNDADFDRVDGERAASDAILVGANTIRRDNPRLLVRSQTRRAERLEAGLPSSPAKVTVSSTGALDPAAQFFSAGDSDVARLVYVPAPAARGARTALASAPAAEVVAVEGDHLMEGVLADLATRGVKRLFAEGGTTIHSQFLTLGLADELHLVVAPFFVGGHGAPRFVTDGDYPFSSACRMELAEARPIGDVVLLRYLMPASRAA